MSEEAIQDQQVEDVSDVVEQEGVDAEEPKNLTPREEKLNRIYEKHDEETKQFVTESGLPEDSKDDDKDEGTVVGEPEVPEGEPVPDDKPKSPVYLNDKGEYVMKLKVNGVEVERSVDQVVAAAQKNTSADQRLYEASQRENQLNQREQQLVDYHNTLNAERQRLEQLASSQPSSQDVGNKEDVAKLIGKHREMLLDGDIDGADEVMMKIINMGRNDTTLNVDDIVNQAVQRSVQEQQRIAFEAQQQRQRDEYNASLQRGGAWARENYSDLLSDPDLYRLIDSKTEELSRENPNLSPEEIIKQATEQVAQRFGKKEEPENKREANKQRLPSQPKRLANSRHTLPKVQEKDMSPAGAIAREKARRAAIQNRPN